MRARTRMRIGIYYIVSEESDHSRRLKDLRRIRALQVNAIATYLLPIEVDQLFVRRCMRHNIDVIVERGKKDTSLEKLDKVMTLFGKSVSGILSFDDVDSNRGRRSPDNVKELNEKIKNRYPKHELYMSGGYPARIDMYKQCSQDKILFQGYPIGNDNIGPAGAGLVYWDKMASLGVPWAPVIQAFAWPGAWYPSQDEIRSMTYQALACGVNELWFYTYYDGANNMSIQKGHRRDLRRIIQEVKLSEEYWNKGGKKYSLDQ